MRCRHLMVAVVILTAAAAYAEPMGPPAERPLNVPASWLQFEIDWKPTWDETLQANPDNKWQAKLQEKPETAQNWQQICYIRRIETLKAMMKRWPAERQKHIDAYILIGQTYQKMGWPWWHSWWGYKLVQDFPDDPNAVQLGYQMVLSWGFGQYTHWGWYGYWIRPECRDWEFAIYEIIDKHKAGKLANGPAVRTAYSYYGWLLVDFVDYGSIHPFFDRMKELSKADAGFSSESENVLNQLGHDQQSRARGPLFDKTPAAREAQFELETRWAAQHADLFEKETPSFDVQAVQRLLDLMAETDSAPAGNEDRTPFWALLDKRLTSVPRERVAALVAAQNDAAKPTARTALAAGDGDKLLRAFRRYPLAPCLHEALVDLAERDIREGLSQWAVPVLWAVVTHTDDAALRGQAYAGLWVALSQDPADRAELDRAMKALGDDTRIQWRGAAAQAGEIKKQLLAQAPVVKSVPRITLPALEVRRIELPRGWPTDERNLDGPAADLGVHAPWPVSWIERVGSSLIVGAPTAVARFDAGAKEPAWMLNPPQRISDSAWPWSPPDARSTAISPYVSWRADRRPVRTGMGGGTAKGQLYCLMNTVEPPIVAAIDVFTGQPVWSTENGHGWDGMEPLSQPAESEGRLYVLAAPPEHRTANWRAHPRVDPATVHLVCLDADSGRVLWKRGIGWRPDARYDLARGSTRVLVQEGRVYCLSNVGLLARCGAHDGMLQWMQAYPLAVNRNGNAESINPRREGTGPVVVRPSGAGQTGAVLLVAPRDHTGVMAFVQDTGKLLWETPLVPSDRLIGATETAVVGINEHWLTALDLATGRQLYCREFPAGTGSAGILVGSDVVLVSGGVLHRVQADTGATLETRDLQAGADAEFTILPDATVVQIVPPPLAPPPGPSTAGKKLALPLEKIWSVPCESPRLLLRQDPTAGIGSFGLVTGRRVACVSREPTWRVTWDALLPRPPQAAGFTGNNLITADLWTLSARKVEDGRLRWSRPLRFAPAMIAGDETLAYAAATGSNAGTPHYAVLDALSGETRWSRCLGTEFFSTSQATLLRREPDGTRLLRVLMNYTDQATGAWGNGEVRIDAANGKVLGTLPVLGNGEGYWSQVVYDDNGFASFMIRGGSYWGGGEHMTVALGYDGKRLTDNWKRRFDFAASNSHYGRTGVHVRGHGVYARLDGYLLFFEPATGAETMYSVTRPGDVIQPFIFDFREDGDRLIVVSGLMGLKPPEKGQRSPAPTPQEQWRMYVDIFERATGKSMGRQELPGVLCCVTHTAYQTLAGYESQVRIDNDAIVITDINGVHIFASKAN